MKSFFTGSGALLKLFALTILYFQVHIASSETKLVTSENDYFEIIGSDLKSVSFLNDLSVFTASVIQNELSFSFNDPPRKVLVRLREFDDVDSYICPISEDGSITLNFNWNDSLSLNKAIEGLTIAFIQSYCFSNYGNQFLDQTIYKAWSIECLSALVEIRLRPKTEKLYWSGIEANALSVEFFDHQFFSTNKVSKKNAFLIWKVIKTSRLSKKERRAILFKSFQGLNALGTLNEVFQKELSDPNFNFIESYSLLYSSAFDSINEQFESLEKSREWLNAMTKLHVTKEQSEQLMTLHEVWENRKDEQIQSLLQSRLQLIALVSVRINPVYYNALQSLALVYQKILSGDKEWDSYLFLSDFLQDFDSAERIHNTINSHWNKNL